MEYKQYNTDFQRSLCWQSHYQCDCWDICV